MEAVMTHVSKEQLFERRLDTDEMEIGTLGTIKYRALSRQETLDNQKAVDNGVADMERKMLSSAIVEPELTYQDVQKWQQMAPPNEIEPIVDAITKLSGLGEEADKEAAERFPE
jgi:hypothetical protein